MFENFVVFTEAVKLSSNVFYRLSVVNYHNKLLKLIYRRKDVISFREVADLVENKILISKFVDFLNSCDQQDEKLWLEGIFKAIDYIDIGKFGRILWIFSSKNGFLDCIKYLVNNNIDMHMDNDIALKWAASKGYLPLVKYLIERPDCKVCNQQCIHGIDIHVEDDFPLNHAAGNGHLEVVKYLIEKDPSVHLTEALTQAAQNSQIEVVKYLISKGANIMNIYYKNLTKISLKELETIHFLSGEVLKFRST